MHLTQCHQSGITDAGAIEVYFAEVFQILQRFDTLVGHRRVFLNLESGEVGKITEVTEVIVVELTIGQVEPDYIFFDFLNVE